MLKGFISGLASVVVLSACSSMPLIGNSDTQVAQENDADQVRVESTSISDEKIEPTFAKKIAVATPKVSADSSMRFERAKSLISSGDDIQAIALLDRITRDQPELAGPWVNMALIQIRQKNIAAAELSLTSALNANAHNCDALNQMGILARRAGNFEGAESFYKRCIKADPSYAGARLNLGILYELYMGRYSEALAAYQDYQLALIEPDTRVDGWMIDLERRAAAFAQR